MLARPVITFALARHLQRRNGLGIIKLSQSGCSGMPNFDRTRPQEITQQGATHLMRTYLSNTS
jgi:hypothetical protein